jgi:hypothetical protein
VVRETPSPSLVITRELRSLERQRGPEGRDAEGFRRSLSATDSSESFTPDSTENSPATDATQSVTPHVTSRSEPHGHVPVVTEY